MNGTPTIATQMLWAYWRRGALFLIGLPWGIVLLFSLMTLASGSAGFLAGRGMHALSFTITLALSTAVIIPAACFDLNSFGFQRSLYVMPVSTKRLVAIQMACALSAYAALVVIVAALIYIMPFTGSIYALNDELLARSGFIYSIHFALLFGLPLCAAILASLWGLSGNLQFPAFLACIWAYSASLSYEMEQHAMPLRVQYLTSFGGVAISYLLAVPGVTWRRRGGSFELPIWESIINRRSQAQTACPPFKSTAQAQFWYEWRQKGYALPVVTILILTVPLAFWVWNSMAGAMDAKDHLNYLMFSFLLFPYLISLGVIFIGLLIGQVNARRSAIISPFLATRPVRDSALSASILKVVAVSLALSYAIFIAFLLATALWLYLIGQGGVLQLGWLEIKDATPAVFFPVTVILAWSAISLGSSLAMTGRPWLLAPILIIPIFLFAYELIADMLNAHDLAHPIAFGWLLASAAIVGVPLAYAKSLKQKHIKPWLAIAALALWCSATAVMCHAALNDRVDSLLYYAAIAAFFALPFAAFAIAPLALAWNRHR